MGNWKIKIIFGFIILLAFFLRIYLLGVVPPGLTNDEADIGYDAYSILQTGKDQWGQLIPVTSFKGFGDYRLALYTYLVIPFIKVVGLNAFAVRLPSAILGTISVILVYFLCKKLFEKHGKASVYIGLSAALFFAISPWSVALSRIGIESNIAITFILAGFISFLHSFTHRKLFFLSVLFFALTIYTYTSYSLYTPLVLVTTFVFFKKEILKYKKIVIFSCVFFLLLISPLFIFKSTAGVRASQISFINSQDNVGIISNLNDRRGSCLEKLPSALCKIAENKQVVFTQTFIKNYLDHFSLNFLYLDGTNTQYSILPQRSLFYIIEFIVLVSGILYAYKTKNKNAFFVVTLLLLSPIPDALTGAGHYSRASNMMPFIFILEGLGLAFILQGIKNVSWKISTVVRTVLWGLILLSFISFWISYTTYFPKYYSTFSQYGYEEWTHLLLEKKNSYDRIYLSRYGNDTKQYVYYLFYTKYNPGDYQMKKKISVSSAPGGWISIDRIGNLFFVDRIPSEESLKVMGGKKVLLVTHPTELPKNLDIKSFDSVKDNNGNTIFVFIKAGDLLKYYNESGQKSGVE